MPSFKFKAGVTVFLPDRIVFGAFMRAVTNGHLTGNIGASMELFCTKDTDWSYQSEWRLIANAGGHFKYLKIKAIYLGFKVSKINENKMKKYSQEYGFDLYKMDSLNYKRESHTLK